MNATKINWCDVSWNPVIGCSKIAQGCKNCYADNLHTMRHRAFLEGKNLPKQYADPFNKIQFFPERLSDQKLKSKKPLRIFVNFMSDLFHEDISFDKINSVYEVMGFFIQHTFLVLTKRIDRALEYYNWTSIFDAYGAMANVQIVYSASTQRELAAGVSSLLSIDATVRGVSLEPLIEQIDLVKANCFKGAKKIDWVIVGCESGSKRRECIIDDVRLIVKDCREQKVPVWVKQLQLGYGNKVTDKLEDFPADLRIRETP